MNMQGLECAWCACQISPHSGSVIFIIRLVCGCAVCVPIQLCVATLDKKTLQPLFLLKQVDVVL